MELLVEVAKSQGLVAVLLCWVIVDLRWVKKLLEESRERLYALEKKVDG